MTKELPPGALEPKETVKRLREALARVESLLGGKALAPNSRFVECLGVLERTVAGNVGEDEKRQRAQAFLEVSQLLAIDRYLLRDDPPDAVIRKLRIAVKKDPPLPQDSGPSTKGRDFQFELYLASLFKGGGLEVHFERADLEVTIDRHLFVGVEAKRLKGADRFEERMEKAREQLHGNAFITHGVIALDVTFLANPQGNVVVTGELPAEPVAEQLTGLHAQHAEEIIRSWSSDPDSLRMTCAVLVLGATTHYLPTVGGVVNSGHIRCSEVKGFEYVMSRLKEAAERCFNE